MVSVPRLIVFLAFCMVGSAPGAHAAMLFCNHTNSAFEAAFGRREDKIWLSEGWWQIQPGQCARVYGKPLTERFYFYYARALNAPSPEAKPKIWGGKYNFCTDDKAFRIEGDDGCESRSYVTRGFHEIDIGQHGKSYTLNFEDKR